MVKGLAVLVGRINTHMDSWAWSDKHCHRGVCPVLLARGGSADRLLAGGSMGEEVIVAVPQRRGVGTWCLGRNSLVAQMVKNLPAMQETQVQSLAQENPIEKGMATYSNILAWRIP